MKRLAAMAMAYGWVVAWAAAIEPEEKIRELRDQFEPTKPTVVVKYSLEYRFMSIRLMRIAQGVVRTTEGIWHSRTNGNHTPVFFMDATMDTYDLADAVKRKRVSMHDHMVSILTNPEAQTVVYVRAADQYFNPLIGQRRANKHLKVYNLESGDMDYYCEDYLKGETNNVLHGSTNLLQQGREVAVLMKLMAAVYAKERPLVEYTNSPPIFVDIDGQVVPFQAQTRFKTPPVGLKGQKTGALEVDVRTVPGSKSKRGHMTIWMTSLRELAGTMEDAELAKVADQSPAWSIVPLLFEYDLTLGAICGVIKDVYVSTSMTNDAPLVVGTNALPALPAAPARER